MASYIKAELNVIINFIIIRKVILSFWSIRCTLVVNYNNAKHIREISMLQTRIVQMPLSSNQDVEVFTVTVLPIKRDIIAHCHVVVQNNDIKIRPLRL